MILGTGLDEASWVLILSRVSSSTSSVLGTTVSLCVGWRCGLCRIPDTSDQSVLTLWKDTRVLKTTLVYLVSKTQLPTGAYCGATRRRLTVHSDVSLASVATASFLFFIL